MAFFRGTRRFGDTGADADTGTAADTAVDATATAEPGADADMAAAGVSEGVDVGVVRSFLRGTRTFIFGLERAPLGRDELLVAAEGPPLSSSASSSESL